MWSFKRGSRAYLGVNSGGIKDFEPLGEDARIWKLQPANADAGFLIVYKDDSGADRYVPRWANLEDALFLRGPEPDRFNKANEITSVFVVPDIVGRVESEKGFLFEDEDRYRVYLHPYRDWTITKEWVPTRKESSWRENTDTQYLKKVMDDWETAGLIKDGKVIKDVDFKGPSAWVWNGASPRRWKNINISGEDWGIAVDQEGERRIEKSLGEENYFHVAINRKASPY